MPDMGWATERSMDAGEGVVVTSETLPPAFLDGQMATTIFMIHASGPLSILRVGRLGDMMSAKTVCVAFLPTGASVIIARNLRAHGLLHASTAEFRRRADPTNCRPRRSVADRVVETGLFGPMWNRRWHCDEKKKGDRQGTNARTLQRKQ